MESNHLDLELRRAVVADASRLAAIHRRARVTAMPWLPVLHTAAEELAWMTNVVLRRQEVWVAVIDEAMEFVALGADDIEHLYVAPAAWRVGVGTALLDRAKERRPDGFRLWTFQRNAMARAFYRKHGLVELRITDGSGNEEREPVVQLGWKLVS